MKKNLKNEYWKKSVVYQIYPKSFNSYKNESTGDIKGIIEKLDYLSTLGVDYIWLTPIYQSPQRDNGYDISNYFKIDENYGTMEDFEQLVKEAQQRNLGIIMDIVVNHTSTDHKWFKEASTSKNNYYRDFYVWRDEPNNWASKFGGSAWEYDKKTDQYYLHLFDKTQADLNWENKKVREEIFDMMRFWVNKGISGFRLDVINLISKDQDFPNDYSGDGRRFYTDGPKVHEYLQEMHKKVWDDKNFITVGEMSSTTIEDCIKYSNPEKKELDMTFNFHHLKVDYPNNEKWVEGKLDFLSLKDILSRWQVEMHKGDGWNALFWCNHDQPRVVSRFGDDELYRKESAKMLATTIHMMQGTPYIYQGEEIGMTNPKFDNINDYRDVETLNIFDIKKNNGIKEKDIMKVIKEKSRDNARTPMQWDSSKNAGFSKGDPWIKVASNYREINVENALKDENSIFYHYSKLIRLRKKYDIITYGDYQLILPDHKEIFAYIRNYKDEKLLVINNFFNKETIFEMPDNLELRNYNFRILISNYKDSPKFLNNIKLRPYESVVYYLEK